MAGPRNRAGAGVDTDADTDDPLFVRHRKAQVREDASSAEVNLAEGVEILDVTQGDMLRVAVYQDRVVVRPIPDVGGGHRE